MRRRVLLRAAGGAAAAAVAVAAGAAFRSPAEGADDPFVVHEWGTFTSMSGSDGVALEGLSREEEALPEFVYSRTEIRDCPLRAQGWKGLEVAPDHVTQKMETPVLYFRSRSARKARVRVDFVGGLITQWYPVSDLLGPPERGAADGPLDMSKVGRSFLEWDVDVLPLGAAAPAEAPRVSKDDPWHFAREVEASWLRTTPRKGPERAGPVEAERYLFYRGLGNFPLSLTAEVSEGAKIRFRNRGAEPVRTVLLYEIRERGGELMGRMTTVPEVPAGGEARAELLDGAFWGDAPSVRAKLEHVVREVLVDRGLREDEALAMVRTWSRSWFTSEGMRALWIVPGKQVEALLPLSIQPKPDALVRVLVGRMEMITPEDEREVEAALRDRWSGDARAEKLAAMRLYRCGRFLEPHVRNVLSRTKDPIVRAAAEKVLAGLGG